MTISAIDALSSGLSLLGADGHGVWTCLCPDFKFRRAAKNEDCKHIRAVLEEFDDPPLPMVRFYLLSDRLP